MILNYSGVASGVLVWNFKRAVTANNFKANILPFQVRAMQRWALDLDPTHIDSEHLAAFVSDSEWEAIVVYSEISDARLCGESDHSDIPAEDKRKYGFTAGGVEVPKLEEGDVIPARNNDRNLNFQTWPEFRNSKWLAAGDIDFQIDSQIDSVIENITKFESAQVSLSGPANVWVVKPGTNSKASGVFCMTSLPQIMSHCLNGNRIVQKYCERPLLLFSGRKFDIRQWVLVRSFQPLKIYVFSSCYLRMCNKPFDLGDLNDRQRHISNWEVNKHGKQVVEGAVVSQADFAKELAQITKNQNYHEEVFVPKMHQIIVHTMQSVKNNIVQRPQSFELFGVDTLVDENLDPWLLEVNLSPGCAARSPFIVEMLERSASRLFDIVVDNNDEPDGILPDWNLLWDETPFDPLEPDKKVACLSAKAQHGKVISNMGVNGVKINNVARKEKAIDDHFRRLQAVEKIGKVVRGFLARNMVKRLREGSDFEIVVTKTL